MSEDKIKPYIEIIELQDTIINDLIEALQHFVDCDGLPCVKLIKEAVDKRMKLLEKENDVSL